MNNRDQIEIAEWVEKYLDDSLGSEELAQLEKTLMDRREARELFLDLMHQNAHLQLERLHLASPTTRSNDQTTRGVVGRWYSSRSAVELSLMAVLAASLLLVVWWKYAFDESPSSRSVLAEIVDSSDAKWGECTLPTAIGSELPRGRLKIERGLTTLRFASGAEVTLEAPAEFEIQSPLKGKLLSGTAVVEVPDSAHGFTLSTPTAVAIDYGTAFAVSIDNLSHASSIEVLDGEVEVQHVGTNDSRRLTQRQRVVASSDGLRDSKASNGEAALTWADPSGLLDTDLVRITTADGRGRDASVGYSQDEEVQKNSRAELVLVKNPYPGFEQFSRKGYFAFDLDGVKDRAITSAKFVLALQPSGFGFASKVGDCEFVVYGVTEESSDGWSPQELDWDTAPANANGAAEVDPTRARELGRFVVERGQQYGQVFIEGEELVDFLNADTNSVVTLVVVRATTENAAGGLVHGFANRSNSIATPPALLIGTDLSPDPR